jgi:hypothetical protein
MRLQLTRGSVWLAAGALLLALGARESAHADGVIHMRGAYYKERSTRVQQPMIDAQFDAGEHGEVRGHLLVDSITSASVATGAGAIEFNEKRYEGGLGYTHELPGRLRLGGQVRYSTESDYTSAYLAAHAEVALFDQTTTLRLLVGHATDDITNGVAVMMGSLGTPRRAEELATTLASLGVTQVITPRVVGSVTYDLVRASGYQANIYRVVRGGVDPVPERVPDLRLRHAVATSARLFLPTRTTLVGAYRFYGDDWGIVAHTPELRVIQEVMPGLDVRLRYRYYTQTAAEFYKPVYMQSELSDPSVSVTDDEKLSAFATHTFGGQVSVELGTIGFGGWFGGVRVDAVVEHVWQETSFGDAWVAQLGVSLPFTY